MAFVAISETSDSESPESGSYAPVGAEFQVNTYATSYQSSPITTALNDGGFVITWMSYVQDGDGYGIYAQRYDANGSAVGDEFQVNTYTTSFQWIPNTTALNDGGFVITWGSDGQDSDGYGVYAQRYAAIGSAVGAEFQVNTYTTSNQYAPSSTALSDGGFVITWMSEGQDGDHYGIYAQRYDANASAVGDEFQVNTYTTSFQYSPSTTALSDGGFVITWMSEGQDGADYGIYAQRYDANASAVGDEFQVNTYTTSFQWVPNTTALNDGGFVITWHSYVQDGDGYGIYAQRYDANASAIGDEFQVNTYTTNSQDSPSTTALSDGGFVITWGSDGQDSDGYGVYAQRYAANGSAVGAEFQVNTYTTNSQRSPSTTALNDGGFVVTWQSMGQDGDATGIYAQRYAVDVNEAPTAISLSNHSVEENIAGGVVGSLSATDTDNADSHAFTLSGTDAGSFEVVDGQLKLKDSVSADYETKSSYSVSVTATDSGDLTYSTGFTVIVNDVNEVSGTVSFDSETSVQELYISYFGRPADPAGLAFYAESLSVGATTINAIASSFSDSTEAQAVITLSTDAYLTAVYLQAFARAYDNLAGADGTFWFDAIERGATTKELAMVQILSGAQGADITAVANKVAVSKAFTNAVTTEGKTYAGAVNAAAAKAVLDAVTSDAVTMTSGKMAAQAMVTLLTSFSLTSVVDTFVGTANDSTIDATAKVEVLAGRSGADSFVFATGDTGITLATADTITDFTTADDVVTTSLVAGNVTIADGSGLTDFSAFVTAADAVLASGAGIDDAYEAWDVTGTGNAWLVIDENDSGLVDAGDTLIILAGVNTADKFVLADIA